MAESVSATAVDSTVDSAKLQGAMEGAVLGQAPSDLTNPPKGHPGLDRTLIRLQWILLKRTYRKNWSRIVGLVVALLYGAGALGSVTVLLISTLVTNGEYGIFPTTIRYTGVVTVVLWTLLSLFSFGVDDTLSPTKLTLFGKGPKELLRPVFLASLINVGFIFTLLGAVILAVLQAIWLVQVLVGGEHISTAGIVLALIALVPMTVLGLILCVLIPRAIFAWRATLRVSKRKKETLQAAALVVVLVGVYSASIAMNAAGDSFFDALITLAERAFAVLLWTPFGAPFAVPIDLAEGLWVGALVRLAITLVTIWLLWAWWGRSFAEAQLQALKGASGDKALKVTPLVPRLLPANALGASVGRSLRYWRRDPRYSVAMIIMPILGIFFLALSVSMEDSKFQAYVAVMLTAWLLGALISNEIGFDGPAGWVNITAGIDNRANLLGRYIALALFGVPWMLVVSIAAPLLHHEPEMIALTIPLSFGFLLSSWGISMLTSVFIPYESPRPGSTKSNVKGTGWISLAAAMLGVWLPMTPAFILVALGFGTYEPLRYVGAALALVIGVLTFVVSLRTASKRLDARYPDIFQKVKAHLD